MAAQLKGRLAAGTMASPAWPRWITAVITCAIVVTLAIFASFHLQDLRPNHGLRAQQWRDPPAAPASLDQFAAGNTAFALELYHELSQAQPENLIVSPLSISAMLAVLYSGAEGETRAEIKRALHFDVPEPELHAGFVYWEYELETGYAGSLANSVWLSPKVRVTPSFRALVNQTYNSQLIQLDTSQPSAAKTINDWVALNTSGHISDAYSPQAGSADPVGLVCVNCLDFLASWNYEERFDEGDTASFYLDETHSVVVPFIVHMARDQAAIGEGFTVLKVLLDPQLLSKPYSFNIILPDERTGLADVEKLLTPALLQEIEHTLAWTDVTVQMPELNFRKDVDVIAALQKLGVQRVFKPEAAELGGIGVGAGMNPLFIGAIQHAATIRLNDKGVAASAATVVPVMYLGVMMPPEKSMQFTIDHPFLFWIRDEETGLIAFMGRVTNPLEHSGPAELPDEQSQ